jgi:uncharacterized protein YggU (UPF0235/DUF167 family)
MFIDVFVKTSAKKDMPARLKDGRFVISVKEAPVKGLANKAVINYLSEKLNIPARDISIVSGLRSKYKRININTSLPLDVEKILNALQM